MRGAARRFGFIVAAGALVVALAVPARGDVLTTDEGRQIDGTFLGFDGGTFRMDSSGRVLEFSADTVKSVVVVPSQQAAVDPAAIMQINQSLAALHQRMDQMQYQLAQLAAGQQAGVQQIDRRTAQLNPVSRMTVEQVNASFQRNGSFRVTGFIRNLSGAMVFNPMVRIDLIDAAGSVVYSQEFPGGTSSVGPNSRTSFRLDIPNPPKFDTYQVNPVITYTNLPQEESGYYQAFPQNR